MRILLLLSLGSYGLGAVSALLWRGSPGRAAVAGCAAFGATAGLLSGIGVLATGDGVSLQPPFELLNTQALLRVDALAAVFLVVVGLVGVPAAIFGYGYSKSYEGRYSLAALGVIVNLLLLFLTLTLTAESVVGFLFAWEAMTLAGFAAVLTEHDRASTIRAAIWYVAISQAGFLALVVMFLILGNGDPWASFSELRAHASGLPVELRSVAFALALVGFGAKAGIVPLHVWLPMAHPVAPSHVSALLSGAVVKIAVYGFLRVAFDLAGIGPASWGAAALLIGVATAMGGVLYALMQPDLKRLLAFSTIENVGIIVMAAGAALLFRSYGLDELATLALVACLYHVLAHAAFKALLFLGAGSVLHATGTRNMETLGGLARRMPWTSAFFLLGAVSVSALPPLAGFASEWLVFQALLGGARIPDPEAAAAMSVAAGALALAGGLAAACFVRAFGISFLGLPRSDTSSHAHESGWSMRTGMALLAGASVALGLLPSVVAPALARVGAQFEGLRVPVPFPRFGLSIATPSGLSSMSPLGIAALLVITVALVHLTLRALGRAKPVRLGSTWGCGRYGQTPRMQYTAMAFAEPLRRIFAAIYRPTEDVSIDFHPASRYFVERIHYASDLPESFAAYVYNPLLAAARAIATRVRRVQVGSVHAYLLYLALTVLVALVAARVWH